MYTHVDMCRNMRICVYICRIEITREDQREKITPIYIEKTPQKLPTENTHTYKKIIKNYPPKNYPCT